MSEPEYWLDEEDWLTDYRGIHGNADVAVLATLHRSDDMLGGDSTTARHRHRRPQDVRSGAHPASDLWRAHAARHSRPDAEEPCGAAQLSDLGASAFSARGNPARDAAILLRERKGRHAVLPRYPRGGLPT